MSERRPFEGSTCCPPLKVPPSSPVHEVVVDTVAAGKQRNGTTDKKVNFAGQLYNNSNILCSVQNGVGIADDKGANKDE